MIASSPSETMQSSLIAQSICHLLRLPYPSGLILSIANNYGHIDLVHDILQFILLALVEKARGQVSVERPQAIINPGVGGEFRWLALRRTFLSNCV